MKCNLDMINIFQKLRSSHHIKPVTLQLSFWSNIQFKYDSSMIWQAQVDGNLNLSYSIEPSSETESNS